nr:hypothetical protein [Clostridium botulinum]
MIIALSSPIGYKSARGLTSTSVAPFKAFSNEAIASGCLAFIAIYPFAELVAFIAYLTPLIINSGVSSITFML